MVARGQGVSRQGRRARWSHYWCVFAGSLGASLVLTWVPTLTAALRTAGFQLRVADGRRQGQHLAQICAVFPTRSAGHAPFSQGGRLQGILSIRGASSVEVDVATDATHRRRRRRSTRGQRLSRHKLRVAELLDGIFLPDAFGGDLSGVHEPADAMPIDWAALPEVVDPLGAALLKRSSRPSDALRYSWKRRQVEAFAAALQLLRARGFVRPGATVVDFGCSTGNLLLPLAALFTDLAFVGVDNNFHSIRLLCDRIASSGLCNVQAWRGSIEDFESSGHMLDLALGLHVCGEGSDRIVMLATKREVPWLLSPCCIGKVLRKSRGEDCAGEIPLSAGEEFTIEFIAGGSAIVNVQGLRMPLFGVRLVKPDGTLGKQLVRVNVSRRSSVFDENDVRITYCTTLARPLVSHVPVAKFLLDATSSIGNFTATSNLTLFRLSEPPLTRPRSRWMERQISSDNFTRIAEYADCSRQDTNYTEFYYKAKTAITVDRGLWASEHGYAVELRRMAGLERYSKDELLVGYPQVSVASPSVE